MVADNVRAYERGRADVRDALRRFLDEGIRGWRAKRDIAEPDSAAELQAKCYVDAYQSVRVHVLGEPLGLEE